MNLDSDTYRESFQGVWKLAKVRFVGEREKAMLTQSRYARKYSCLEGTACYRAISTEREKV